MNHDGPVGRLHPGDLRRPLRYSGAGLSYNVGGILGGALVPGAVPELLSSFGGWAITAMMAAVTVVNPASILVLRKTAGRRTGHF